MSRSRGAEAARSPEGEAALISSPVNRPALKGSTLENQTSGQVARSTPQPNGHNNDTGSASIGTPSRDCWTCGITRNASARQLVPKPTSTDINADPRAMKLGVPTVLNTMKKAEGSKSYAAYNAMRKQRGRQMTLVVRAGQSLTRPEPTQSVFVFPERYQLLDILCRNDDVVKLEYQAAASHRLEALNALASRYHGRQAACLSKFRRYYLSYPVKEPPSPATAALSNREANYACIKS
ncbi:uncharacterized protein MYCFIDRAFT_171545 [Pseudocercospora fijiensis CIRAD86]|uniref:Uncharacterized protein n=1 Tax=Pseudocercospora fijiensis (strain CIRAD86) TaxID=383855 RepID=M3AM44_PSEFD|nr:uncharacterized protein MYCFIDRAFT_171545 [Pseudocercospora fijiensis CIRAD86]EME85656.1 hypothetical protein MYCFIDRAFT_171545 [Pseudocercospora fijiensis CIRAD86]